METPERMFSCLKMLTTYPHSTMTEVFPPISVLQNSRKFLVIIIFFIFVKLDLMDHSI